jgi:hypothetical protein
MLLPDQEDGHSIVGSLHLRIYIEALRCGNRDKSFPRVSRDSSGGTATEPHVGPQTNKGSIPGRCNILFIFSKSLLSGSGAHPASCSVDSRRFFLG